MHVQAYLFFEGRCEEALAFYQQAIGAEVQMKMRFQDSPEPQDPSRWPPGAASKVMHASFRVGETVVMASDGMCGGKPSFQGMSLSLTAGDDAEAQRLFTALSDGGQIHQALTKTFFASSFGVLVDRFGVSWMVLAGM